MDKARYLGRTNVVIVESLVGAVTGVRRGSCRA